MIEMHTVHVLYLENRLFSIVLSLLYDLRISGAETIKEIVREANRCESCMPSLTKGSHEITMTVP